MKDEILIPFTSDMVRAICTCAKCGHLSIPFPCERCSSTDFIKTQTRRVISERYLKPQERFIGELNDAVSAALLDQSPYGKSGARLVVREKLVRCQDSEGSIPMALYDVGRAPVMRDGKPVEWRWKTSVIPSRFMPREAGRIPLENCGERVERVQDITEEDAIAEGVFGPPQSEAGWRQYPYESCHLETARESFQSLWDSINAQRGYGWDTNSWVWAITFRRVTK